MFLIFQAFLSFRSYILPAPSFMMFLSLGREGTNVYFGSEYSVVTYSQNFEQPLLFIFSAIGCPSQGLLLRQLQMECLPDFFLSYWYTGGLCVCVSFVSWHFVESLFQI